MFPAVRRRRPTRRTHRRPPSPIRLRTLRACPSQLLSIERCDDRLNPPSLVVGDERTEGHVSAFVRERVDVPSPTLCFADIEYGQQTRSEEVLALTRGEGRRHGRRQLAVHALQLMRGLPADQNAFSGDRVELQPGEPVTLELDIETEEGTLQPQLEMRPVAPRPGAAAAFAGYTGSSCWSSTSSREAPTIPANIAFSSHFGESAAANAEAADLLYAFYSHVPVTLRNELFWPETRQAN